VTAVDIGVPGATSTSVIRRSVAGDSAGLLADRLGTGGTAMVEGTVGATVGSRGTELPLGRLDTAEAQAAIAMIGTAVDPRRTHFAIMPPYVSASNRKSGTGVLVDCAESSKPLFETPGRTPSMLPGF
jgi:hypothetical protein